MSSERSKKRSKKKQPSTSSSSSAAKIKSRKRRFMSLNNHLAPTTPQQPDTPEPVDDDNESQQVACLLEESTEPDGRATITDLFGNSSVSSSSAVVDEVLSPASPSVEWDGEGLARRALRGRERWVFCRSSSSEEVTQKSTVELGCGVQQGLQLKLDYQEILSAWSDRGSLYIDGEGPQVVPQLQRCCGGGFEDDSAAPSVFVEVGSCGGWRVPEMADVEGKEGGGEGDKINREERVMRYKAKRQSRLFAKRIRYEVRKVNAEKRPRIKGRFVKRVEDM